MSLALLPEEVIILILALSSPNSIRQCQQLSHQFQTLVLSSPLLQHILELNRCGYHEAWVPRKDLTLTEQTQMLREHIARRNHPCDGQPVEIEVPIPKIVSLGVDISDYHQGIYAHYSRLVQLVQLYQLPSVNHGTEFKQWAHPNPGDEVVGLAIDASLDLLVWLEAHHQHPFFVDAATAFQYDYSIHLRSLEGNQPHHMAKFGSTIAHSFSSAGRTIVAPTVHIIGNLLAVLFVSMRYRTPCHIIIWNWTTGVEMGRVTVPGGKHTSFAFISDRLFIVSRSSFFFENDTQTEIGTYGRIDTYSLDHLSDGTPFSVFMPVMQLSLPPLSHRLQGAFIKIRRTPSSVSLTHAPANLRPKLYDLPSDQVICVDIRTWPTQYIANEHAPYGTLLIPTSAILRIIHSLHGLNCQSPCFNPPIHVQWSDWAYATYWADTAVSDFRSSHAAYGKYFASLRSSRTLPAPDTPDEVAIFGFGQADPLIASSQHLTAAGFFEEQAKPKMGTVVSSRVDQTFLPLTSVLMDDEYVIIQTNWREHGYTLLVYNF
ncbi:hypothetical protein BDV93DRAFT_607109 [Ceratobasidium sp. AG-I]|nr:hypothetical protein BDV93DRAFT_607109 [Ceratobasidium sp. AG-I]